MRVKRRFPLLTIGIMLVLLTLGAGVVYAQSDGGNSQPTAPQLSIPSLNLGNILGARPIAAAGPEFRSQHTYDFPFDADPALPVPTDLHIVFDQNVTVWTDPLSGNAGPFGDINDNGHDTIDLSNPQGAVPNPTKLKFRSDATDFKIKEWWWTYPDNTNRPNDPDKLPDKGPVHKGNP